MAANASLWDFKAWQKYILKGVAVIWEGKIPTCMRGSWKISFSVTQLCLSWMGKILTATIESLLYCAFHTAPNLPLALISSSWIGRRPAAGDEGIGLGSWVGNCNREQEKLARIMKTALATFRVELKCGTLARQQAARLWVKCWRIKS